ncbi:hypothetical protein MHN28_18340 [Ruegeria sp. Ofav3-42]|nr:hypothetical protein [Ruegeria sp. Ofav3-42]
MTISKGPSDAELSVMVRKILVQSIEQAKVPTWRVALLPMLLGSVSTLAVMAFVKWLVDFGLL